MRFKEQCFLSVTRNKEFCVICKTQLITMKIPHDKPVQGAKRLIPNTDGEVKHCKLNLQQYFHTSCNPGFILHYNHHCFTLYIIHCVIFTHQRIHSWLPTLHFTFSLAGRWLELPSFFLRKFRQRSPSSSSSSSFPLIFFFRSKTVTLYLQKLI